jgi:hypothetical protein
MTTCSDLADYEWLTGDEASAILAELADDKTPLHTAIARLRGRFTPAQTHLLLEQTELRRRATAKFTQAHQMFFTRIGLEQATDECVAAYKATRFTTQRAAGLSPSNGPAVFADLCCGIGGDLQALAANAPAIGIDRDPIIAHFAAINTGAPIHTTDIATFDLNSAAAFHIDPDRRPTGRRTTSLEWCEPNIETIDALLVRVPNAAIKLAPASEVPPHWSAHCELEWISRDRECRQLVAWHGALAKSPAQNRATILPAARHPVLSLPKSGLAPRTITGHPKQPIPIADKPNQYVYDIDPAVLAAKLKGVLAAEHNLTALSAGSTYLTGDNTIIDLALTCFAVEEVMPFRIDKLAKHLAAHDIGQLEIKKRGVDINPEKLRRDLKLRGNNSATLLITPIAGRATAILAQRVSS